MTQNENLLNYLSSGRVVNEKIARRKFGITRLSARVQELRSEGYPIYTNTRTNGVASYRLGTPSRAMIAAAFNVFGSELFR